MSDILTAELNREFHKSRKAIEVCVCVCVCVYVCELETPTYAANFFVDGSTTNTVQSGGSWAEAFKTVEQAIAAAPANARIFVAEGTYTPGSPAASRLSTFRIPNARSFYGGFVPLLGNNEPRKRDLARHESILSGDIGTPGVATDNCYHVVVLRTVTDSTVLDGFTISGGRADVIDAAGAPAGEPSDRGGGGLIVVAVNDPDPFTNNGPVLQNCTIEDNFARTAGGGLASMGFNSAAEEGFGTSNPTIQTTVIRNNLADDNQWNETNRLAVGGGVYATGGTPQFVNAVVTANTARRTAGGVFADYGTALAMHGCTVADNLLETVVAGPGGGGLPFRTAGIYTFDPEGVFGAKDPWQSVFVNTILWGNHDTDSTMSHVGQQIWSFFLASASDDPNTELALRTSCIQDLVSSSNGNIATNPLFVGSGDYRLSATSPCKDSGSVNPVSASTWDDFPLDKYDVDDDGAKDGTNGSTTEFTPDRRILPRVYPAPTTSSTLLDRGAFEWRCRYDLDDDGQPNVSGDLGVLLGAWGTCTLACLADLDVDGDVDASDLGILLGLWGGPNPCEDVPAGGAPLMGNAVAPASEGAPLLDSPQALAEMFGFEDVASFSMWLATLTETERWAVLSYLLPVGGGDS